MTNFGKIYTAVTPTNYRLQKLTVLKSLTGFGPETTPEFTFETIKTPEFLEKFPVGKVPGFIKDDFKLFDSSAILMYVASKIPNTTLLGKNEEESALIQQFMFFTEAEIMPAASNIYYPARGMGPYNKPVAQHHEAALKRYLAALNTILLDRTYLVGERLTVADINLVCGLSFIMRCIADPAHRKEIRNVTRYFKTMIGKKGFKEVFGDFEYCKETVKPEVKAKEPKKKEQKQPKKAEKAPKPKADEEEEEKPPAPKPKSELDLLPKSSFDLEDWKRFYSNNDTKPTAMDYFWQHFDPEGYSIYKVDYKYNDELTLVFMSNNLVGGFFNRLESARKYAFGVLLTLGVNNDNMITGYFVIRGSKVPFEVTDAPDYESFNFTKVDHTDPKVREEVGDVFAWEGPSLPKPFADGKAFK
ncbi:hypothetical protein BB559_000915 [Furculomyces boomerangus]|uniref:Elongation factor 1-gamma n=2 Tax=Harpellales TaxID=61421 RepID=A0A2T9Z3T0_9FUNG|nr:hypothetical protein BB559_000915 [Furculomyces boomerangus]PVZ96797.1 hypothetical protein BB558_007288 [Smittium angustum]PVZ98313.1 hypothetical protein BB558_005683 [Smittium angustum]